MNTVFVIIQNPLKGISDNEVGRLFWRGLVA